ncbi:hypothetical protein SUGI_0461950 [Cryptomeria japonica]|nr:hypothetical protein SUGI_0461950 [Cryptomeria japonica]
MSRIYEASSDVGSRNFMFRAVGKRSTMEEFLDWSKGVWGNLLTHTVKLLDHGFFLVSFPTTEDCRFVQENGPWFIGRSDLFIASWSPFCDPANAHITSIPIWIRLYNLPLIMRNVGLIESIVDHVGSFIMLEDNSSVALRYFTRVCAMVDISRPFHHVVRINSSQGSWLQYLNYKGLPECCFRCNQFGHKIVGCHAKSVSGLRA